MVWYNGRLGDDAQWMISSVTDFNNKRYFNGYLRGDFTECPESSTSWREWSNSAWSAEFNIWEEAVECADLLLVANAQNTANNGYYRKSQFFLYEKPIYWGPNNGRMIWFDGSDDWVVGSTTDYDNAVYSIGYVMTGEVTQCPEMYSGDLREWYGGEWTTVPGISITSEG